MRDLQNQTWLEIQSYLKRKQSLLIPVGTCEQHGRHLPFSTDTIVAEYIVSVLSKKSGILDAS